MRRYDYEFIGETYFVFDRLRGSFSDSPRRRAMAECRDRSDAALICAALNLAEKQAANLLMEFGE